MFKIYHYNKKHVYIRTHCNQIHNVRLCILLVIRYTQYRYNLPGITYTYIIYIYFVYESNWQVYNEICYDKNMYSLKIKYEVVSMNSILMDTVINILNLVN